MHSLLSLGERILGVLFRGVRGTFLVPQRTTSDGEMAAACFSLGRCPVMREALNLGGSMWPQNGFGRRMSEKTSVAAVWGLPTMSSL